MNNCKFENVVETAWYCNVDKYPDQNCDVKDRIALRSGKVCLVKDFMQQYDTKTIRKVVVLDNKRYYQLRDEITKEEK